MIKLRMILKPKWFSQVNVVMWFRGYRVLKHSEYFDAAWYLSQNPDVRADGCNPFWHYLLRGYREGRNPSAHFDGVSYLRQHPDVEQSGMNPLVHYELFGRCESRRTSGSEKPPDAVGKNEDPVLAKYRVEEGNIVKRTRRYSDEWRPCPRQPFFSVIMPAYNRVDWIPQAVDSLLAQNYSHFELIICDDGSTDGSGERIASVYAEAMKNGRIIYVPRPHAGCAAARNYALQLAKGDWIAYLDTDNRLLDGFLETFAAYIGEYPRQKIFYAQARCRYSGTVIGTRFDRRRLAAGNYIDLGAVVHARSVYEQLGGFDPGLTRLIDWDLLLRYVRFQRPMFLPRILLEYNDSDTMARISNNCDFDSNAKKIIHQRRIR